MNERKSSSATAKILAFNRGRDQRMIRFKYKFMKENMFRFFRGSCHLFYEYLSATADFPPSPAGWICGDLHLENFGSYRSRNDQVYFDLNDFDEAILAPICWEVARTVTSIFVAFESLHIDEQQARNMAALYLKTFTCVMRDGKAESVEARSAQGIIRDFLLAADKRKQKDLLDKKISFKKSRVAMQVDSTRHFRLKENLKAKLTDHVKEWLRHDEYSPYNYKVVDVVYRLAGTGSVGLKRYAFLLKSRNDVGEKYIIVDMKQSTASSLAPYVGFDQPEWESESLRIVATQFKMQNRCPALMSTSYFEGEPYVMQELQPTKDSINFKLIKDRYRDMYKVVDTMAMLSASSILRSSGRQGAANADEFVAFAKREDWTAAVLEYSFAYSRKVKSDYADFLRDYKAGAFKYRKEYEQQVPEYV